MKKMTLLAGLAGSALLASGASAAFVAETDDPIANFGFGGDTTTASASVASSAIGTSASNSLFGGNGSAFPDTYIFSYTPGTDADNFSPAAGSFLGEQSGVGDTAGTTPTATGIAGGATGFYNVYITVPASTNISGGDTTVTVSGDGAPVVNVLNLNSGGTGANLNPDPNLAFVGGANNAWHFVGEVAITAGTTSTVTFEAGANTFVSMRAHGALWEFVRPIPEPGSLALLGLGGLAMLRRRRA